MEPRDFELWDFDTKSTITVKASNQGNTWMALCPKHPDTKPSLKIDVDKKRYFCFGCNWKGVFYDPKKVKATSEKRKIVATFNYENEDGNLLFQVIRREPKDFCAKRPDGKGGWIYNMEGIEPIPYRLPELIKGEDPVFVVEGERHTDTLREMGFTATTNPFGAGKWRESYNQFLKDREIVILPDNDPPGKEHGEKVAKSLLSNVKWIKVVELPNLPEKGDVLDFLKQGGTKEQLLELIEKTDFYKPSPDKPSEKTKKEETSKHLEEQIESLTPQFYLENEKEIFEKLSQLSEVERELKFKTISDKLKVSKTSIKNSFNSFISKGKEEVNVNELLEKCEEGCRVYTAQNYCDGILSYGAVVNGTKLVIESNKNVIQSSKEVNMKFARSKLTKEAIKRFLAGENVNGKELHERLSRLFSDHVIFPDDRIPGLLATWVIGTYFYKTFPYYGYLLFVSVTKRCAKSLAEDLLSCVCHNATSRSVNPSEASVFRQVDGDDITLIIDEVETLSSKEKPEMVGLINSGFQKGSTVTRIESKGKEFYPVLFNAYSPKILAGIRGVSDTIEDRSFKIPMIRKAPGEKVKRFNLRRQEDEIQLLKDDLYIFGLRHGPDVIELYDLETGKIPGMEGFDDRQKDILEPLACINLVIDELAGDENRTTFNALIELSKTMGKKRISQEKLDGSFTAILEIMGKELRDQDGCFIPITRMFEMSNQTDGLNFRNTRQLGRYMAKLDIYSEQQWIGKENIRGYSISKAWLEDQKRRYIS